MSTTMHDSIFISVWERLNFIIFLNVLLGAAQLGVAGSSVNKDAAMTIMGICSHDCLKDCSEPLGVILLICGALNFVQVHAVPGFDVLDLLPSCLRCSRSLCGAVQKR